MTVASLPEDGELRLGPVTLPAGERRSLNRPADMRLRVDDSIARIPPVAWVTTVTVPDPGTVWLALSEASRDTGLVPFLAASTHWDNRRPWDSGEFQVPDDLSELDRLDAASFLKRRWDGKTRLSSQEAADGVTRARTEAEIAPFSWHFPGLAPATDEPLDPAGLQEVLGSLPPARIGLAAASRPADVLPTIGWIAGNMIPGALPAAAVLRSWEDRFGARLLEVGRDEFRLLVERPPHALQAAQRIAAEQYAFADECSAGGKIGLTEVGTIAPCLVNAPIWGLWWD
jgi:hypothetical protein